jgi:hypothetical protein
MIALWDLLLMIPVITSILLFQAYSTGCNQHQVNFVYCSRAFGSLGLLFSQSGSQRDRDAYDSLARFHRPAPCGRLQRSRLRDESYAHASFLFDQNYIARVGQIPCGEK